MSITKKTKKVKAWATISCETGGIMNVYLDKSEAFAKKMWCDEIEKVEIIRPLLSPKKKAQKKGKSK